MTNPKKAIFYPSNDGEISSFFAILVEQLVLLAAKYSISAPVLTKLQDFSTQLPLAKKKSDADQAIAKQSVQEKETLFAEARKEAMRELKRIVELDEFEEKDAMAMGIRKEVTAKAAIQAQAILSDITVLPDEIRLDWVKGKFDGVAIEASYDGNAFAQIGIDMKSPYEDRRKNKTAGQPETRHYRLRYLKNDEPVGQYSDVKSVVVDM